MNLEITFKLFAGSAGFIKTVSENSLQWLSLDGHYNPSNRKSVVLKLIQKQIGKFAHKPVIWGLLSGNYLFYKKL